MSPGWAIIATNSGNTRTCSEGGGVTDAGASTAGGAGGGGWGREAGGGEGASTAGGAGGGTTCRPTHPVTRRTASTVNRLRDALAFMDHRRRQRFWRFETLRLHPWKVPLCSPSRPEISTHFQPKGIPSREARYAGDAAVDTEPTAIFFELGRACRASYTYFGDDSLGPMSTGSSSSWSLSFAGPDAVGAPFFGLA